jgi:hypothetical protein
VNGNQKTIDPFTGTSEVFAINCSWNFDGTLGIKYWPRFKNGASARIAETAPMIFRNVLRVSPDLLSGDAPSNPSD